MLYPRRLFEVSSRHSQWRLEIYSGETQSITTRIMIIHHIVIWNYNIHNTYITIRHENMLFVQKITQNYDTEDNIYYKRKTL